MNKKSINTKLNQSKPHCNCRNHHEYTIMYKKYFFFRFIRDVEDFYKKVEILYNTLYEKFKKQIDNVKIQLFDLSELNYENSTYHKTLEEFLIKLNNFKLLFDQIMKCPSNYKPPAYNDNQTIIWKEKYLAIKKELADEKNKKSTKRHTVSSSYSEARLNESIRLAMVRAGKDGAAYQKLVEELKNRILRMEKQLVELREENETLKQVTGNDFDIVAFQRDYQDMKYRYQKLLVEYEKLQAVPSFKEEYNKLIDEYIIYILDFKIKKEK